MESDGFVTTTCTYRGEDECKHKNGWYFHVYCLFLKKKYYVCTDCLEVIVIRKWHINWGI